MQKPAFLIRMRRGQQPTRQHAKKNRPRTRGEFAPLKESDTGKHQHQRSHQVFVSQPDQRIIRRSSGKIVNKIRQFLKYPGAVHQNQLMYPASDLLIYQ